MVWILATVKVHASAKIVVLFVVELETIIRLSMSLKKKRRDFAPFYKQI